MIQLCYEHLSARCIRVPLQSDIAPVSSKEFLDIQATIECEFTLKRIRDMIRTHSQIHRIDKYSQDSSTHCTSLAKWLSVFVRPKWLWVRVSLQSLILTSL